MGVHVAFQVVRMGCAFGRESQGIAGLGQLYVTTACREDLVRASLQEVSTDVHGFFQMMRMLCAFGKESQGIAGLGQLHDTIAFSRRL